MNLVFVKWIFSTAALVALAVAAMSPALGTASPSRGEPLVVVSGVKGYWEPATASITEKKADLVVDTGRRYQTWHGLGGTFNEAGWRALQSLTAKQRADIMELLFSKQSGVGFEWGRIPIGASDFALSRYTLNDTPGDTDMSEFSIEHDRQWLIPYIKAAQLVKSDIKFWGSPWTPPAWMKTNKAYDGGAFNPEFSEAYARYFLAWVQAYEKEGIAIDHVQPQNEPGWSQDYPSCAWGPATANGKLIERDVTLGDFVEKHLAPTLAQHSPDTEIWYGTLSNGATFNTYWKALTEKGRAAITGVGLQWGTRDFVSELARSKGKNGRPLLVMQTEHMCGNYPWLNKKATSPLDADRSNFLPSQAPNNPAYAEESWDLLTAWIKEGVHVYSAWNLVLDSGGFNMDIARPWPQNALIAVNTEQRTYRVTPAYYVFRHIGQFVAPQAQRIELSGGDGLAFENPDKRLVVIVHNEKSGTQNIRVSMHGATVQVEVPGRGWATLYW